MGRLHNQIDAVRRQIDLADRDLAALFDELGMASSALRPPLAEDSCAQGYADLVKMHAESEALVSRIEHLRNLDARIAKSNGRLAQLQEQLRAYGEGLTILYARIGVIAWEESSSHVLDSRIAEVIPHLDARQKRTADIELHHRKLLDEATASEGFTLYLNRLRTWISRQRMRSQVQSDGQFFATMGSLIAGQGLTGYLASGSTAAIESEYSRVLHEMAGCREEILMLDELVRSDKQSLADEGLEGSVQRKIAVLEEELEEKRIVYHAAATSYGRLVRPWLEKRGLETLPEPIVLCLDQIRRHERVRSQLEQKIKILESEIEVSELLVLIQQDEERIEHLQQTINQFNKQLEEVQLAIETNKRRIHALRTGRDTRRIVSDMVERQ